MGNVVRNSLFRSGYELLFTPLPERQKRPAKGLIDVGADKLGAFLGGAIALLVILLVPGLVSQVLCLLAAAVAAIVLVGVTAFFNLFVDFPDVDATGQAVGGWGLLFCSSAFVTGIQRTESKQGGHHESVII